MGRLLMIAGGLMFALGLLIQYGHVIHLPLGRLPGDIVIRGKNSTFYFPVVTCLLLSLVFSLVTWLLRRR